MSKIIKLKDIQKEENLFFKKDYFGYRIIHPISKNISIPIYDKQKKTINWDNINWRNLITGGHWLKPIITIVIILIILGCLSEYSTAVKLLDECLSRNIIQWKI